MIIVHCTIQCVCVWYDWPWPNCSSSLALPTTNSNAVFTNSVAYLIRFLIEFTSFCSQILCFKAIKSALFCSMIQLGEDLDGIFDDGNFPTLSRFQVKYPPSRNPYKCFPLLLSLNVSQPLTDRAA